MCGSTEEGTEPDHQFTGGDYTKQYFEQTYASPENQLFRSEVRWAVHQKTVHARKNMQKTNENEI